jgi:Uma2 family endonuclease
MIDLIVDVEAAVESRRIRFAERPITFAQFLELTSKNDDVELIDGVLVEKIATRLEHEKLFMWLARVIGDYVEARNLGIVLGSRTAVEINEFGGRLPDILFVRQERLAIVQDKAIYGAPDLVIELVSPGDRPSDVRGLETDYRSLGVPEIVFVDRQKQRVRVLRKRAVGYEEETLTAGALSFETIEGLGLQIDWLMEEPRPVVRDLLTLLLPPE